MTAKKTSKTQQALAWLKENPKKTPHAAAVQFGISAGCLYSAIKRRAGKTICQCCGQIVKAQVAP